MKTRQEYIYIYTELLTLSLANLYTNGTGTVTLHGKNGQAYMCKSYNDEIKI